MKPGIDTKKVFQIIALLSLLSTVFLVYANKVDDLDLWWHLKTGEHIYQTRTIPDKDVFSYASELPSHLEKLERESVSSSDMPSDFAYWSTNLNHSWLGQLILYLTYAWAGVEGIAFLKSLLFVCAYAVLYLAMLRGRASPLISFLVLSLVAYIGFDFNYSRPQLFSFLLFPSLFYLFYDFKNGGHRIYVLPAMMFVWANLHAGFVMGVVTVIIFTCGELVQYMLGRKFPNKFAGMPMKQLRVLLIVSSITVLVSLLNPNGYKIFLVPLTIKQSIFFSHIEEYHRPMLYEYHAYWLMLLLVGLSLIFRLKRLNLSEVFVILYLMAASQLGIRVIIFFALGSGAFLSASLTDMLTLLNRQKWISRLSAHPKLTLLFDRGAPHILLATMSLFFLFRVSASGNVLKYGIDKDFYPDNAIRFIKEIRPPGRLFNLYNWGGYLIWRLPEYRVFIDGRCLNETAFFHYQLIMAARQGIMDNSSRSEPLWKRLLAAYNIQFILTNTVMNSGQIIPLVDRLSIDPDWQLVYQDGKSVLLLRDTEQNRSRYKNYFLPKKKGLIDEIISECKNGIAKTPATWGYYETLGMIYLNRYELNKAEEMFEKYYSMNQNNRRVIENLNFIRRFYNKPPIPLPEKPESPHKW